jgi:hypothetical protein
MAKNDNLFKKLTTLFRSGPIVKRKVKQFNKHKSSPSSLELFRKAHSDVYNSTLSAYGSYDRMARYSDFSEMEATPEISSALDIYSEECVSQDADGYVLHVHSDNRKIKELLDNLFYDILNIDFNMVMWSRNLCKYGDFFLFNDISPEYGVINTFPIPIAEIEREEGYDPEDPAAVRFRWITQGNRILENWQVSHFRLLGNDAFLPYGSSVLEGARRIWRQLILIEDAMLVYRVIRSPERRVFYIDVGNIPPENVADYLEQAQSSLKRNAVVDKTTGQVDLRYNPLSVDEDYFLPVRGSETGTRIDSLAGGANTGDIEDVEYIQKKLFAALKVPKAYLGYDEDIGAKATLAQEDIRFSRTIQRIQKTIISELNKLAMIHLYTHGYGDEDIMNFELKLSNPSSIAQQQKLELIRTKFDIASSAPENLVDREWVQKYILDFNDEEIERIRIGIRNDKIKDMELEQAQPYEGPSFGDEDRDGDGKDDVFGGDAGEDDEGGDAGGGGGLEGLFAGETKEGQVLGEEEEVEDDLLLDDDILKSMKELEETDSPIKPNKTSRTVSSLSTGNIDIKKTGHKTGFGSLNAHDVLNPPSALDLNSRILPQSRVINDFIDRQMVKSLSNMDKKLGISKKELLRESNDDDKDILIDILKDNEDS